MTHLFLKLKYNMPDLLPTQTFINSDYQSNIYLRKGDVITDNLLSPVLIKSPDLSETATITVLNETDAVPGTIAISPGLNASNPLSLGLQLSNGAEGIVATVGDSTIQTDPVLQIAGRINSAPVFSRVFDALFNPPVGASTIIRGTSYDPVGNPNHPGGWLTNSPQPGILLSSGGNDPPNIQVAKTGLYMIQATLYMPAGATSGGGAGGTGLFRNQFTVQTVASPFTAVGGLIVEATGQALFSDSLYPAYFNWSGYVPLEAGVAYTLQNRSTYGGGVFFGATSDLVISLIQLV
jgi:hypothetical protein